MCRVLYIASDRPLPLVYLLTFYVQAIAPDKVWRGPLSLPHCYYVGTHSGCGCGFELDPDQDVTEQFDGAGAMQARGQLWAYLTIQLEAGCVLEALTGWPEDGKAATPLSADRPAREVAASFCFERREMERFRVVPDQT